MKHIERSVTIKWKLNPSAFELINQRAFLNDVQRLGSAIKPVNTLLSRSEEMRVLLPSIVGATPQDTNWQERISNYLHNILIEVPKSGYTLNTSFTFDKDDSRVKANVEQYIKTHFKQGENPSDDEVIKKMFDKTTTSKTRVEEEDLYKYVIFTEIEDYIKYRFCLLSREVANNVADINKSVNIRFFLTSDAEIKEIKANRIKLRNKALKEYNNIISDTNEATLSNAIIALNLVRSYQEYKALTLEERQELLLNYADTEPAKFIVMMQDKNLALKARITTYIWLNILKILPESSIIVDSTNAEIVIGNNIDEAVTYFSNDINKAYISELNARYKSLK